MKIVSYHGFVKENTPDATFKYRRNLVSYYLSKSFVVLPKYSKAMKDVWIEVKNFAKALGMHKNYMVTTSATVIPSIVNMLKNVYLSNNLFGVFVSKL